MYCRYLFPYSPTEENVALQKLLSFSYVNPEKSVLFIYLGSERCVIWIFMPGMYGLWVR